MGCGGCQYKGQSTAVEDTFVGVRFGEETNLTLCRTDGRLRQGRPRDRRLRRRPAVRQGGEVADARVQAVSEVERASASCASLRSATSPTSRPDQEPGDRQVFCRRRSEDLGLEMKISKVDFSLNGRHATFFFTANGRVDFRQLVRDWRKRFSTRVKMVQVGARDEAALLGGIGICGRRFAARPGSRISSRSRSRWPSGRT